MKRFLFILLILLLLCGCTAEPVAEETLPPTEAETLPPTEPTGCYEPGSPVEEKTDGAVRSYPIPLEDSYAMAGLGTEILVFSGEETTTLTIFSGENLFISASISLDQYISPDQPSTQVTAKGISYFCADTGELVLLDTSLKEVARIAVPEELTGTPVMSADRKAVYYCTPEAVRMLDLETGISRMLLQISYPGQSVEALLLKDTVLQCRLTEENGDASWLFLSTADGTALYKTGEKVHPVSYGDQYYAFVAEGAMRALVFGGGKLDGEHMLLPRDITAKTWLVEAMNAAVTGSLDEAHTAALEYYSLADGRRSSRLELENSSLPVGFAAVPSKGVVYLLCISEETGGEVIYRWDISELSAEDPEVYTTPRYTRENPDQQGLEECREIARELSRLHGVEILLGEEATAAEPWDYSMETEYQVPLIRRELENLSGLLSAYPEQFLSQAAENTSGGVIRIALVRSITGTPESGNTDSAAGVHYWLDENPYIALAVGRITENVLYHELFHAIETKVFADSQIYYEWDKLNPDGFEYDYNYTAWMTRQESEYLEDENRAFIDSYSMSFPNEDRARIMEYAMAGDNSHYFQSEIMQEKLYQLCLGIRKAFGLTKSEEAYLWEQYLEEPLAYVPKK